MELNMNPDYDPDAGLLDQGPQFIDYEVVGFTKHGFVSTIVTATTATEAEQLAVPELDKMAGYGRVRWYRVALANDYTPQYPLD